jgi:hypothetical protein
MIHALDGMFENPMDDLNKILKDLNIKKTRGVMTKLVLYINPFICTIAISARINKVEERSVTDYNPFDYPSVSYFSLADRTFKLTVDYNDSFEVLVEDHDDGTAQPMTIKFVK